MRLKLDHHIPSIIYSTSADVASPINLLQILNWAHSITFLSNKELFTSLNHIESYLILDILQRILLTVKDPTSSSDCFTKRGPSDIPHIWMSQLISQCNFNVGCSERVRRCRFWKRFWTLESGKHFVPILHRFPWLVVSISILLEWPDYYISSCCISWEMWNSREKAATICNSTTVHKYSDIIIIDFCVEWLSCCGEW